MTYVMEAMRAMVPDGWDLPTIFTGVWVAGVNHEGGAGGDYGDVSAADG